MATPPPAVPASPPAGGRTPGDRFRALHVPGAPLLMPNAWDIGSAVLLASAGFAALATTSGGFAASRGRLDGAMRRDEVLTHAGELASAVDVPVSADLENCFAHDPGGVAATMSAAVDCGLAGASVEDFSRDHDNPIYDIGLASERVAAAAEAAHGGPAGFVLTARAENHLHGRDDLSDTMARLQAYQEAGADVLFAPRVVEPSALRALLAAVDRPVSVLLTPGAPSVGELAALGVSRISVGGALAAAAYGYALSAAKELRDRGTAGYWELAGAARVAMQAAFERP